MRHVKVNFPYDEAGFEHGNGEGMFVIVTDEVHAEVMDDSSRGVRLRGILDNDSIDRPFLVHGLEVEFVTRGEFRPVALMEGLEDKRPDMEAYREPASQVG